ALDEASWAQTDAVLREAKSRGLTVLPILGDSPFWAFTRNPDSSADCLVGINCHIQADGTCNCPLNANGSCPNGYVCPQAVDGENCLPYANGSFNYAYYTDLPPKPDDFVKFVRVAIDRYKLADEARGTPAVKDW